MKGDEAMKYPEIAKRFNYILLFRNLKQQELADKAGINKSFISHYVNGTHCPSNDKAQLLSEVLDVNPLWLMGLDDNMFKGSPTELNKAEEEMLSLFNSLSNVHQQAALDYLMFLNSKKNQSSENPKDS